MERSALFWGGPLTRTLVALDPRADPVRRRAWRCLGIVIFVWAPLAIATALEGRFAGVPGAFAADVLTQVRLLFGLPLLFLGELAVERRLAGALDHLVRAGLVPPERVARYQAARAWAQRVHDAAGVEIALVALAALLAAADVRYGHLEPWMLPLPGSDATLSFAGAWDLCLSAPVYRFLLGRWLWKLGVWTLLLARLARLPLRLEATHPDRMGGLGVLSAAHGSFGWAVLAVSATLAASFTMQLRRTGGSVDEYGQSVGAFCVAAVLACVGPMLVFVAPLELARRRCEDEYGAAAAEHARRYVAAHVVPGAPPFAVDGGEPSTHIDLSSSFERSVSITALPLRRMLLARLLAAALLPMALFYLQQLPLLEIARRLRGALG